ATRHSCVRGRAGGGRSAVGRGISAGGARGHPALPKPGPGRRPVGAARGRAESEGRPGRGAGQRLARFRV
ncbi:MAG: hypothetical protein AVDCRST_MAG08-3399, partial [uncultured Acetobacteraceae bacterium]